MQAIAANLGDEAEVQKVVSAHSERYGRLDVLVNNAGVGVGASVAEIETKRMDMQININLRSIVIFYRECVAMLRTAAQEHKNALVVNTSSISGKHGEAWLSVYSVTKHAAQSFAEWLAITYGDQGIRVSALCPQGVRTNMLLQAEFGGGA